MKIYKTKIEIAKIKGVSIMAVNNWEKTNKIVKLVVDNPKDSKKDKKAGYIILSEALKELILML